MVYKWSKTSQKHLNSCDKRLQDLANLMLSRSKFDLTITCGHRTEKEQENAYISGKSNARFGQSKHNFYPSQAIDIIPCPVNWDKKDKRWQEVALNAMWCAGKLGFEITWGGSFKSLEDYPHYELKG